MIYLDNAATTAVLRSSANAAVFAMTEAYGNPSSLYHFGIEAERLVNFSREKTAAAISAKPEEIFFTSGATESNNAAVLGLAETYGRRKKRVVTTAVEHPSVAEAFKRLGERGYDVVTVTPDQDGNLTEDMLFSAVDENTCLISAMLVNNETGYILPIGNAFKRIKKAFPDCMTHCDCVQGFMKLPFTVKELSADALSFSGHKVHAPKGIGGLYLKKGVRMSPLIVGGGQQNGVRSGTESVPLIYAFGKAVEELSGNIGERLEHAKAIKKYAVEKLIGMGAAINSPENASPYIISASVPGIKSETMLHYLESVGIAVSSGSACSKGKKSRVLTAFGLKDSVADTTIRISTSYMTTKEEIDRLADGISEAMSKLVRIKR